MTMAAGPRVRAKPLRLPGLWGADHVLQCDMEF